MLLFTFPLYLPSTHLPISTDTYKDLYLLALKHFSSISFWWFCFHFSIYVPSLGLIFFLFYLLSFLTFYRLSYFRLWGLYWNTCTLYHVFINRCFTCISLSLIHPWPSFCGCGIFSFLSRAIMKRFSTVAILFFLIHCPHVLPVLFSAHMFWAPWLSAHIWLWNVCDFRGGWVWWVSLQFQEAFCPRQTTVRQVTLAL